MKAKNRVKAPMKQPVLYKGPVISRAPINNTIQVNAEPQEPPAKKVKTSQVVYVEQKKKKLEVKYDPATVPSNYQLVQYGNKDVIEFLLERSRKKGHPVWTANANSHFKHKSEFVSDSSKLSSHVGRTGYYFHKDLVAKALKRFNVTLQKGKLSSTGSKGNQKVTKADHEKGLIELYPHMPDRDRQTVLRALTTKGTKIGKATGTMNVYKQIELAVIAHVRHSHTDYEKLIYMSGKVSARNAVESDIAAKLAEWKGEDGQNIDENETELVEYEDDTSSESEDSTPVTPDEDDDDYSPPPAEHYPEQQSAFVSPAIPSRPWSRQPEASWQPSLGRTVVPRQFGTTAYDDYEFEYRQPPPRQYSPQMHDTRYRPLHEAFRAPMPDYGDVPNTRVQLRPLPPSPLDQGQPSHHPHNLNNSPWFDPAATLRYEPAPRPLPQHSHSYGPRDPYYDEHRQTRYEPPYDPHSHHASPPRIQYRPLSPVPGPAQYDQPDTRPYGYDQPAFRYRPLSPEDVIPSREHYSPIPDSRKRARPSDWDDYAVPAQRY